MSVNPPKSPMLNVNQDTDALIKDLIRQRGILKGRLTKLGVYVSSLVNQAISRTLKTELKLRTERACSLLTEFGDVQIRLERILPESAIDEQIDIRDDFESKYYSILAQAKCILDEDEVTAGSKSTSLQSVKLPTISLPTFDGSYEHWLEFRDTFLSLVHNSKEISNIQKFHYLKSSLKSSAELVIDSLEFSADNYVVAWELLLNRYNNSRLLVHNHVKSLFSIAALTKESPVAIRKLIDTILKNLRSLKILGEPTDAWDTLIIYLVVSKLDQVTEREWEQHKINLLTNATGDSQFTRLKVDDLLSFLKNRADMLETLIVSHSKVTHDVRKNNGNMQNTRTVHSNVSTDNTRNDHNKRKKLCLMCKANHPLYSCQKFLDIHVDDKIRFINDNKLCNNCLHPGHTADTCRYGPCRKCCKKHNTIIHRDGVATNEGQVVNCAGAVTCALDKECVPATSDRSHSDTLSHTQIKHKVDAHRHDTQCAHSSSFAQPILLSTAIVEICDNVGNYHKTRVLLDCGSQRCFITKSLCDRLNLRLIQSTQQIRGIGNAVTQCTQTCNVVIRSTVGTYNARVSCLVLTHITSTLPAVPINNKYFNMPSHITLADPNFYESSDIEILLGADIFWDLLSEGRMRLPSGPFLQNTKLGWIISGPGYSKPRDTNYVQCNFVEQIDLDTQLRKFWELEELPTNRDLRTEDEKACETHFVSTTTRNVDGRFSVRIPLKLSPNALGETYTQAERRFIALERRLQRSPSYKLMYTEFIKEYITLGHMSRVDTFGTPHYFMPHHGVFREHSTTTKLRVVFDASAPSTTNKSLNDLQMVGSPIQGDLVAILLRFREHRYVACADIEKMYRQVLIDENQRDLQLILWRDNPSDPIEIYKLNTVTYGTASAPFLSVRCLKQLASECSDLDIARTINEDFYVDDMITSDQSMDKLLYICNETTKVLASGCFPLRKWIFNFNCASPDNHPSSVVAASKELSIGEDAQCKLLGLGWYNKSDELHFQTQFKNDSKPVTKRTILSNVSQIFDPLGLLSPTVILIKALIQRLWLLKLDWDKPVPNDVLQVWNLFVKNLSLLDDLRVPRHAVGINPTHIELHIFTDASQIAYGACAYIRTISDNHVITVRLLCAKGKVAPLKPVSIPRLELCGALLGARLYAKITESIRSKFDNVVFWTDSTIVLGWLRMAPNLLKTFVQNRVAEIHELTKDTPWRHVSGKQNPADLVSRGVDLDALSSCTVWWEGPDFLRDPSLDCTNVESDASADTHSDLPEIKHITHSLHTGQDTNRSFFPFSRFSQFNRMKRAAAYVLRFIHNIRNKCNKRTGMLSVDELSESVLVLAKLSQIESFADVYSALNNNNKLPVTHNLSKLSLFIDNDRIVRVGGRLENSREFDFNKKHPILISAKHHFTTLLFHNEHKIMLHAGPQALLFSLRETWWPIGGRNLARVVTHQCVTCTRMRAKTITPLMGNLPEHRITPGFPFIKVGVDYAGPVLILNRKGRGAKTVKAYICLFICLVTRAVHLELVSDLSTDAYLLSLKRFISRRGKPTEIFSDNGKNFVGLMNDFAKFISKCSVDIIDYASSQNIKFNFIPPYAPHFGGLWEAGVKSCKYHLRRVVGNAHLTFEEFSTVLTQIEAVLNSRPLSPMSTDPRDFLPLSPAHFLVGRPLTTPVSADVKDTPEHRLTRYQRVEQIRQHFWARWSKEYISELQTRIKWKENRDDLKADTLVLIKDDNLPPLKWHLGRIIATHPGADGISRVADIQTANGVVRRAFSKICPLPSVDH